jgi:cysteinyl-tRNA synthetase
MKTTSLALFDTRLRKLSPLTISNENALRIYSCGPTVYRDAHVGNLRTFLLGDLILRTLSLDGVTCELIQNITDVGHMSEDLHEDKLLAESVAKKIDPFEIAREYEARFHKDLELLAITPATHYPHASESANSSLNQMPMLAMMVRSTSMLNHSRVMARSAEIN